MHEIQEVYTMYLFCKLQLSDRHTVKHFTNHCTQLMVTQCLDIKLLVMQNIILIIKITMIHFLLQIKMFPYQ